MSTRPLVILAAHGGGDGSAANRLVAALAAQVARGLPRAEVVPTFNLGAPSLEETVRAAKDRRIVIVPLMTSGGYFAGEHLRGCIRKAGVDPDAVEIAPAVGLDGRVAQLVGRRLRDELAGSGLDPLDCSVLVIGHGTTRSQTSAAATDAVAEAVRLLLGGADVRTAFLDQEPRLEDVARAPSLRPVIVAYPFLIGGAGHAREDVPDRLGVARTAADARTRILRDDGRSVLVLGPLGEDPEFAAILVDSVKNALAARTLRLGTRGSRLARLQCDLARTALAAAGFATETVVLETEGDRDLGRALESFATEGPFTDTIERALLEGRIDLAVHSCKDLPLRLAPGTDIGAALPRGSAQDALVSFDGRPLDALPAGARVGTCSQRRLAQLRRLRPDLVSVPIRGSVEQRLEQIAEGRFDATILAVAGLERLDRTDAISGRFAVADMMPEAGQGAIVLQARVADGFARSALAAIDDRPTRLAIEAERAFSASIEARTGLIAAALATVDGDIELRGRILSRDGQVVIDGLRRGMDPGALATGLADELIRALGERALTARDADPSRSREGQGSVALVGAGPGDPGLLTVRGQRLLREADVVLYDRLLDDTLLDEAPRHAERIDVGKAPGNHTLPQEEISRLLVEHARRGLRVVRLKGGDPFVFGRGHEELRHCLDHGVPCEVVPGVTSAIAGPAAAGIPVTARGIARTFAIATPQTAAGREKTPLDYAALARIDTVCLLMARADLEEVAHGLIAAGRDPRTAAAVIQDATLPTQRVVLGRLATIAAAARDAGLRAPAVVVVGDVSALAEAGLERSREPLHGKRIVVTRPPSASPSLIARLRSRGATVINCPLIRVVPRPPTDLFALSLHHDWIVFTSLHAVRGFWRLLRGLNRDARAFGQAAVAAVGPRTADELDAIGITPDLVPTVHRASSLVDAIAARGTGRSSRVLFPCGTLARDELRDGLRARGFIVDELVVYDTILVEPPRELAREARAEADAILLYSPSAAESAARAGLLHDGVAIACIGPTTAAKVRELGFSAALVATDHSDAGLVAELDRFFTMRKHMAAPAAGARP